MHRHCLCALTNRSQKSSDGYPYTRSSRTHLLPPQPACALDDLCGTRDVCAAHGRLATYCPTARPDFPKAYRGTPRDGRNVERASVTSMGRTSDNQYDFHERWDPPRRMDLRRLGEYFSGETPLSVFRGGHPSGWMVPRVR